MLSRARKIISLVSVLFLLLVGLIAYDWFNFIHKPIVPAEQQPVDYDFAPGASVLTLAHDLKQLGLLRRPIYFVALAKWTQLSHQLKAGEYRFLPGVKPLQLLDQLAKGRVLSHQLTIVEGWTFEKMMDTIRKEKKIKQTLASTPPETIMAKLGSAYSAPEGLFFPDSYRYTRGTTDLAIIETAYKAMNKALEAEWAKRAPDLPYKSPYEALIVASLIEKETAVAAERPLVAGVIVNRLKKNMLLQIDPTIIYGIGENFKGKIYSADLRKDNPYNTYTRPGLPPTPICLPGMASLHAAMHPHEGDYLYFVARGNGRHQFSVTLNEHKRAVQNYIQYKRTTGKKETAKPASKPAQMELCGSADKGIPCLRQQQPAARAEALEALTNIDITKSSR